MYANKFYYLATIIPSLFRMWPDSDSGELLGDYFKALLECTNSAGKILHRNTEACEPKCVQKCAAI